MHNIVITNIATLPGIWHAFEHFVGMDNPSGPYYGFWSGFGSDLTEFALLGTVVGLYRHHKCETCWRVGHHPVKGTPYKTCHLHATVKNHHALTEKHATKFPAQHELLNQIPEKPVYKP